MHLMCNINLAIYFVAGENRSGLKTSGSSKCSLFLVMIEDMSYIYSLNRNYTSDECLMMVNNYDMVNWTHKLTRTVVLAGMIRSSLILTSQLGHFVIPGTIGYIRKDS